MRQPRGRMINTEIRLIYPERLMSNSVPRSSGSERVRSLSGRVLRLAGLIFAWFDEARNPVLPSPLGHLRQRILNLILLCGAIMGPAMFFPSLPALMDHGNRFYLVMDLALVSFWILILFFRNMKYQLRAGAALLVVYVYGLMVSYFSGTFSGGPVWLYSFAVLTALLLSLKTALGAVLLNIATLIFLAWLNSKGISTAPQYHSGTWFSPGLNLAGFGVLNTTTVVIIGVLIKWMEELHQREQEAMALLRDERCEIVETNLRLMDEVQERKTIEADLRSSEERFRQLVDLLPEAVYELDLQGRVIFLNQAGFKIFDYTMERMVGGINIFDQLLPEEMERARENFNKRLEGNLKGGTEYTVRHDDGRLVDVRIYNAPVYREGVHSGFRGILIDVSDQKRDKEALRFSEEKFSKAFQKSPVWVNLSSLDDGRYLEVNAAFLESTGYERDQVIGKTSLELGVWPEPAQRREMVKRLKAGESVRNAEVERSTKNGKRLFMLLSADLVSIGGEDYLLSVSLDMTEKRKAEEELLRSEKRYRRLFDSITDWIYTQDLEGRFLSLNRAVSETLGYGQEELLGRKASDFMAPESKKNYDLHYLGGISENGKSEGGAAFLTKDGDKVYIEYRSVLVRPSEEAAYISGMGRDVTARITAENELRRLEDQLAQTQKMGAVGTLAAGMAHEFNNTLQAVSGFAQTMLLDPGDEESNRKYLGHIGDVVERAAELVRRMLSFSRKSEVKPVRLDLNRQVAETLPLIERIIPRMITVESKLEPGLGCINADPIQLEQILVNMAINAKDAMPDGGLLSFETRSLEIESDQDRKKYSLTPGRYARLIITDNGVGIPEEVRKSIFEPFFTTKEVGRGTGLGLSTVSDIVAKLNGLIVCKSSVGEWTRFEIFLPVVDDAPAAPREPFSEQDEFRETNKGKETILFVDDEPAILTSAREFLTKSGYRVYTALTGEAALNLLKRDSTKIDLIVLDLNMPGMGGRMALKEFLRMKPQVKVVVASGFFNEEEVKATLDYGAADCIAKPYKMTNLVKTLRHVLDGPQGDASDS